MPGTPENRERFLARTWPQIGHAAESHGLFLEDRQTKNGDRIPGLRSIYNNAAQQGGHEAGVRAINMALMAVRTEMRAAREQEKQQRIAEFKQARMMGVAPQAYQQYRSMSFANDEQRLAFLTMMHSQNPYMGWGNLAAMEMRNQAGAQQAGALGGDDQPLPAAREAQNLAIINAAPVGPGTLAAFTNHYQSTQAGRANPNGAKPYLKTAGSVKYKELHGNPNLTPEQDAFVREYLQLYPTYQAFRAQLGIPDTPANRQWWESKTDKKAEGLGERALNAVTQGASAAGAAGQQLWNYAFPPKPEDNAVADGKKPGRRPFDK